jgi:hypothetical protein
MKTVTDAQRTKMRDRLARTKIRDENFLTAQKLKRAKRERDEMQAQQARLKAYENWLRENNDLKEVEL